MDVCLCVSKSLGGYIYKGSTAEYEEWLSLKSVVHNEAELSSYCQIVMLWKASFFYIFGSVLTMYLDNSNSLIFSPCNISEAGTSTTKP